MPVKAEKRLDALAFPVWEGGELAFGPGTASERKLDQTLTSAVNFAQAASKCGPMN